MAEHLKLINPGDPPPAERFTRTETAADMLLTLRLVRSLEGPRVAMIAGKPGIGKTRTLRHFAAEDPGVVLFTAVAGACAPKDLLAALLGAGPWYSPRSDAATMFDTIARHLRDRVLLVDEAQHLEFRDPRGKAGPNRESLHVLRQLADLAGCGVVLCGGPSLAEMVAKEAAVHDRVSCCRPRILGGVKPGDVAALAAAEGIREPKAVEHLQVAARMPGALRNFTNVVAMARLFAGNGPVRVEHIQAALRDLGIG